MVKEVGKIEVFFNPVTAFVKAHEKEISKYAAITGLVLFVIGATLFAVSMANLSKMNDLPWTRGVQKIYETTIIQGIAVGGPVMYGGEIIGLCGFLSYKKIEKREKEQQAQPRSIEMQDVR